MTEYLEQIEKALDELLPSANERPKVLHEAMRYAVGSGGKRLRPLMCIFAAIAVGGKFEDALMCACAIELLHNYTLVHDDLPSMDNDVERRGKPTVWKKFGEAEAILVGDALLTASFGVAARSPRNVQKILAVLAEKGLGVVSGQVEDIAHLNDDDFIYGHKTADLFEASAVMGGYAGGGSEQDIAALSEFAHEFGMAFQYQDDLLDGDGICSIEESKRRKEAAHNRAKVALAKIPSALELLQNFPTLWGVVKW